MLSWTGSSGEHFLLSGLRNLDNGLVADTSRRLTVQHCRRWIRTFLLPGGSEDGWISRRSGRLALPTLRFFSELAEHGDQCNGVQGVLLSLSGHEVGTARLDVRVVACRHGIVDRGDANSRLLLSTAGAMRSKFARWPDALYRRVDWRWAQNGSDTLAQGGSRSVAFSTMGGRVTMKRRSFTSSGSAHRPSSCSQPLRKLAAYLSVGKSSRPGRSLFRPTVHTSLLARMDRFSGHPGPVHAGKALRLFPEYPKHDCAAPRICGTESARVRRLQRKFLGHHRRGWTRRQSLTRKWKRSGLFRVYVSRRTVWTRRRHDCYHGLCWPHCLSMHQGAFRHAARSRQRSRRYAITTGLRAGSIRPCPMQGRRLAVRRVVRTGSGTSGDDDRECRTAQIWNLVRDCSYVRTDLYAQTFKAGGYRDASKHLPMRPPPSAARSFFIACDQRTGRIRNHVTCFDLVIIGAGPAGLVAAESAARRGFSVALVGKNSSGAIPSTADPSRPRQSFAPRASIQR